MAKTEHIETILDNQVAPMDDEGEETETVESAEESHSVNSETLNEIGKVERDQDSEHETGKTDSLSKQNNSESRPFSCNTCDATFPNNSALKRHENIHTRTKVYQCPLCEHQSTEMHNLKQHLYKHNTGKSYVCEICDRRFKNPMSIRGHVKTNHPGCINKYECQKCTKRFHTQQLLSEHNKEMHSKKPQQSKRDMKATILKCRVCDEKGNPQPTRITHDYVFKLHLKKAHGIEMESFDDYLLKNE